MVDEWYEGVSEGTFSRPRRDIGGLGNTQQGSQWWIDETVLETLKRDIDLQYCHDLFGGGVTSKTHVTSH